MVKKILFISGLFLFAIHLYAQDGSIKAYTDRSVYIAGEKIWIAGMKLGNPMDNDHQVRVYLVDRSGMVMDRVSIMDSEGRIGCFLQLRGDLVSDNYMVAVSSTGYKPYFMPVAVINPVLPPKIASNVPGPYPGVNFEELILKTDKALYAKRERVNVSVQTSADMDVQISVTRKDQLSVYIDSLLGSWRKPDLEIIENIHAGEGHQLKVMVYNAANELASGTRVYASVLGDQANIATAVTDGQGSALISIPYLYGNASLVLSAIGEKGQNYRVVYEESPVQINGDIDLPALKLEERFRSSITERLLNAEVTNKYRAEARTRYVTAGLDTTDFYGKPDKRYMLDDYTRIPNMEEILYEYVLEARARKLGDRSVIYVFNTPFKTFFELPAIVLLDGVPVSDVNQLLALDPLQLKSVDVVAKKFLLDDLQIPGIIHYKSYKGDLAGYKLPAQDIVYAIQGNAIPVEPVFIQYGKENDERLPDMRNLLYWSSFHSTASVNWTFYTTDVEGNYAVAVRGLDRQGNEYKGEIEIRVK
jgi:hypothetical protein